MSDITITNPNKQVIIEVNAAGGARGLSAYQVAVLGGYEGTEEQWVASLKGDQGDAFEYGDFTPEQLLSLKGEKGDTGDAFEYGDFTPEQLLALKGDKGDQGDAFEYSDFTPEELATLKGDKGDQGDAFEYADFTSEQLEGLKGEPGGLGLASNYLFCEDPMLGGVNASPLAYNVLTTYGANEVVLATTGFYWRSLQAGNTGNALAENVWWTRAWHELEKQSDGGAIGSHTANTTSYTELDRYVTGALATTVIPAGNWKFLLYAKITAQSGQIKAEIYRVDSTGAIVGGVLGKAETMVFANTTVLGLNCSIYIGEQTGWAVTDRIGIVVFGKKIGVQAATLTWYHDMASGYGSAVETPLTLLHNQMNGLNKGDYQHLTAAQLANLHAPNYDILPLGTPMTDTDILAIDEAGKYITFNNANARNITVPKNVFPAGTEIFIEQIGAGVFTLVAEDGNITVNGNKKSGGQFCVVGIYFRDATTNANIATVIGGVA